MLEGHSKMPVKTRGIRFSTIFILLVASVFACKVVQPEGSRLGSIEATVSDIRSTTRATSSPVATDTTTVLVAATQTPLPSNTPQPTPDPFLNAGSLSETERGQLMNQVIYSGRWEELNLPIELASLWQGFASGEQVLSPEESQTAVQFLAEWGQINHLLERQAGQIPYMLGMRSQVVQSEGGGQKVTLFLVDESTVPENFMLIVRDEQNQAVGLMPAPSIPGLSQHISQDGQFVEYRDGRGWTMLIADGRRLVDKDLKEVALRERLLSLYSQPENENATDFPRYFVPINGIEVSFYALETSLSNTQIVLLNEAFDLFNRPIFEGLKDDLFNSDVSILVVDSIGKVAGLTYTGTGVIELDRSDLFGNRYHLASVLAHEGSHVLQGAMPEGDVCTEILHREVGDQTIPAGIYGWTADDLVAGIRDKRIGAYHVSYWMLTKLGFNELGLLRDVIQTGRADGRSVVIACE